MRAAQVVRLDGPDGVEVVERPEPVGRDTELIVDVHAAGIAFPDLLLSQGKYQLKPDLPFGIGNDFAGVVRTAPAGSGFGSGDRVVGWLQNGAAAEVVSVPAATVLPLPDEVDFERGACLPLNYLTAHLALRRRGGLQPGETVLVHGAAGGVGTAAIDVAKSFGATVIAVVSSPEKRAVAEEVGADHVVSSGAFLDEVRAIVGDRQVDIVVDVVGTGDLVLDSLRTLSIGGRLLVIGFVGGEIASVKLNRLLLNNIDIRGVSWGAYLRANPSHAQEQWAELLPKLRSGALKPKVGQRYQLEDAPAALRDIAERRVVGKSVIILR